MSEFDIFLPFKDGSGRKISPLFFSQLRKDLTRKFGGVTDFAHKNRGEWKFGRIIYREQIRIFRVLSRPSKENLSWLIQLKKRLSLELSQKEILVIHRKVSRL